MKAIQAKSKTISLVSPRGQLIDVANFSGGKLAFWRREKCGTIFSQLPAKEFKTAKQAAAYVGRC